jgi:hypothetical protein
MAGRRVLPGIAAAGGMLAPALVYVAINRNDPAALPAGLSRPPPTSPLPSACCRCSAAACRSSLKVFLTALAIIDDLGAVIIIAIFYTSGLSLAYLGAAFAVIAALVVLNRMRVMTLLPYLVLGAVLWVLVLKSGVHATLAGVALALTIPLVRSAGTAHDAEHSPLHRLEHGLHKLVPFLVIPIFGFANAGVSLAGRQPRRAVEPLTLGVAAGLVSSASWSACSAPRPLPSARLCRPAGPCELVAHGRHLAALRHRLHHEPVHRPARLRRQCGPAGRGQGGHPCRFVHSRVAGYAVLRMSGREGKAPGTAGS